MRSAVDMSRLHCCFLCVACLLAAEPLPLVLRAQHDLRQRPGTTTTDDPRRVPIPSQDISKDPILVLKGGTLIDGTGREPVANAVLVIQGNRILEAGPAGKVVVPREVGRTIDVANLYIVPGLIDLHMHFDQHRGDDFRLYRDSEAAAAIRGMELASRFLDGGITSVRDVGTPGDVALKLKEAVQRRIIDGPRVFWSGKLIVSKGGHPDEITDTASGGPRSLDTRPQVRVATGPSDWRLAVREQIRSGADLIKVTAPHSREEVSAAIDEAHMLGIRVTADAFGDYITWGVEAGLDSVEHPLATPDEAIRLMAKQGNSFGAHLGCVLQFADLWLPVRRHSSAGLLLHDVPAILHEPRHEHGDRAEERERRG